MNATRAYRKRGPKNTDPTRKKTPRKPRPGALTLKQLEEAFFEPIVLSPSEAGHERRRRILMECREEIAQGDPAALLRAIDTLFVRLPPGITHTDARAPKGERTVDVPVWLLAAMSFLLYQGLSGDWPTLPSGRGAPAHKALSANRDVWCAWHVLKARETGLTLEDAVEQLAERTESTRSPMSVDAISKAFQRVKKNVRRDPRYYHRFSIMSPRLMDVAIGPPYKS